MSLLTPLRVLNLLKLFLSYRHSVFYKKVWMSGLPWALTIEPNNTCNLHCPECPTGNNADLRTKGFMKISDFKILLGHIPETVFFINLYYLGEPLMHPDIIQIIRHLKERKSYISLSTNGHFLQPEMAAMLMNSGLDRLIVSVDGNVQESYEQYRKGGDFSKVTFGIRTLADLRKAAGQSSPYLVMQSLLLRTTEKNTDELIQLGKSLGVDKVELKTTWFDQADSNPGLRPVDGANSRYYVENQTDWKIKNQLRNRCFRMWGTAVITWEGKVLPCCFDKKGSFILGDAIKEPLTTIWRGPEYLSFRKSVLKNRKQIQMCNNCTEGTKI
ncbi:MAG: radical SAM/SPASM domain-containing protein [Bacteroidales bacterium]